ncbi:STAS-like domain-containing protein [Cytophagaceae bacterium ABcell3]|nr:STAS-like domain-containing protein [Cytophagaceae bacterium ABcell3]
MKKINLYDIVKGTSTNADGHLLYLAIEKELRQGSDVRLSLSGCTPMSSSFLNSSFGELLTVFGHNVVRQKVKLVNFKPSDAQRIKEYILKVPQTV